MADSPGSGRAVGQGPRRTAPVGDRTAVPLRRPGMRTRPVLVTGGTGQLATALQGLGLGVGVRRVGRPEFDFDRPETIDAMFAEARPALVVNAAAYTGVDAAESDVEA